MDIKKTANLFANFTIRRIAEIFGITVFCAGVLLLLSLLSYSPESPKELGNICESYNSKRLCNVF